MKKVKKNNNKISKITDWWSARKPFLLNYSIVDPWKNIFFLNHDLCFFLANNWWFSIFFFKSTTKDPQHKKIKLRLMILQKNIYFLIHDSSSIGLDVFKTTIGAFLVFFYYFFLFYDWWSSFFLIHDSSYIGRDFFKSTIQATWVWIFFLIHD